MAWGVTFTEEARLIGRRHGVDRIQLAVDVHLCKMHAFANCTLRYPLDANVVNVSTREGHR